MGGRRIGALAVALALVVGVVWVDQGTSFAQTSGSELRQDVTASDPADGGSVGVQSVEAFSSSGGEAIFEPGTAAEERFTYGGVDAAANELLRVTRPAPQAHPSGSPVQAVTASGPSPSPSGEATPTSDPTESGEPTPQPSATSDTGSSTGSETPTASTEPTSSDDPVDSTTSSTTTTSSTSTTDVDANPCEWTTIDCQALLDQLTLNCSLDPKATNSCTKVIDDAIAGICGGGLCDPNTVVNLVGSACGFIPVTSSSSFESTGLPPAVATCVGKTLGTIELAMRLACQSTDVGICTQNLITAIDATLKTACGLIPVTPDGQTTGLPPGVSECVVKTLGTVTLLLRTVCQSTDPGICVQNLITKIDSTLMTVCGLIPVTTGWDSTGLPPGVSTCVLKTLGTVELAMRIACGSTNVSTCVDNLITNIDSLLRTACGLIPVTSTTGTTTGLPPGVTTCVDKTLGTVELVMTTACQSTNASTCVDNLIATIDSALKTACGIIPVAPDGQTTGLPPGVSACVVKTLGTVTLILTVVCESTDAATCTANLITKIDSTLKTVCGLIPVTTGWDSAGLPPGVSTCILKTLGTIELVMTTACQSTNASTCADNLIIKVHSTLKTACELIPVTTGWDSTGLPPGVSTCILKTLGTIELVMTTACQSTNASTCAENLLTRIDSTLVATCGLVPVTSSGDTTGMSPGAATCVRKALGFIDLVMTTVCKSTTLSTCIDMIGGIAGQAVDDLYYAVCGPNDMSGCQAKYNAIIDALLKSVCTGSASSGAQACVDRVMAEVDNALQTGCGDQDCTDAMYRALCPNTPAGAVDACYWEVFDRVLDSIPPISCSALGVLCEPAEALAGRVYLFNDWIYGATSTDNWDPRFELVREDMCGSSTSGICVPSVDGRGGEGQTLYVYSGYKSGWNDSPSGKDFGIQKPFNFSSGASRHYAATANIKLVNFTPRYFKGRLTIAGKNEFGQQTSECNQDISIPNDEVTIPYIEWTTIRITECVLTDHLTRGAPTSVLVKVRAHVEDPAAGGTVKVRHITLERCSSSCVIPEVNVN